MAQISQLRRIAGRFRRDRIGNEIDRKELGQGETQVDRIRKRRLTWFGHVVRMDDKRLQALALSVPRGENNESRKQNKDVHGRKT